MQVLMTITDCRSHQRPVVILKTRSHSRAFVRIVNVVDRVISGVCDCVSVYVPVLNKRKRLVYRRTVHSSRSARKNETDTHFTS